MNIIRNFTDNFLFGEDVFILEVDVNNDSPRSTLSSVSKPRQVRETLCSAASTSAIIICHHSTFGFEQALRRRQTAILRFPCPFSSFPPPRPHSDSLPCRPCTPRTRRPNRGLRMRQIQAPSPLELLALSPHALHVVGVLCGQPPGLFIHTLHVGRGAPNRIHQLRLGPRPRRLRFARPAHLTHLAAPLSHLRFALALPRAARSTRAAAAQCAPSAAHTPSLSSAARCCAATAATMQTTRASPRRTLPHHGEDHRERPQGCPRSPLRITWRSACTWWTSTGTWA